jgi:hypothetical protein
MRKLSFYITLLLVARVGTASISAVDAERALLSTAVGDGIYELARDARVTPLSSETLGDVSVNEARAEITIPARVPFAVKMNGDVATLTPLVADEALGATPDLFVFSRGDVERLQPRRLAAGDAVAMYQTFSQDAVTLVAGRCKWHVERHLGFHVEGMCASAMSGAKLARVGFHPTSCDRAQLQVWGGGRRGCGHVAYRTRGGGWSSTDYVGDPGSGYYSKGCYSRR